MAKIVIVNKSYKSLRPMVYEEKTEATESVHFLPMPQSK